MRPYDDYYKSFNKFNNDLKFSNFGQGYGNNQNYVDDSKSNVDSNEHDYKVNNENSNNRETYCEDNDRVNKNNNSSKYNSFGPIFFTNPFLANMDEPIIEILGLDLYLDDIIILGLIFFLYKEDVKDELLFLILIFLLIS